MKGLSAATLVLRLPALLAASLLLISACTQTATPADPVAYVNSLRGENNLAHNTLLVPPTATLPDFSATVAAQRYAGAALSKYSTAELAALLSRTGGGVREKIALVCDLPGVDREQIRQLVPEADSVDATPPAVRGIDDVPDALDAVLAARCLGLDPQISKPYRSALSKAVLRWPLVALRAAHADVLTSKYPLSSDAGKSLVADLQSRFNKHGCAEDILEQANALVALGARLSVAAAECARSDQGPVHSASTFETLRFAKSDPAQVAKLLESSQPQVREWTMVRESYLPDWPEPVGFGTLEATRDVVELLIVADKQRPGWISEGVDAAIAAYLARDLTPSDGQAADLLFLCATVLERCPRGLGTQVKAAASRIQQATIADQDQPAARLLSALANAELDQPLRCTAELAKELMVKAPLTLVALAAGQPDCVDDAGFSESDLERHAMDSLRTGALDQAVAYLNLREYLVGGATNLGFHDSMSKEWQTQQQRIRDGDPDDYLGRTRPVGFELARVAFLEALK